MFYDYKKSRSLYAHKESKVPYFASNGLSILCFEDLMGLRVSCCERNC